MSRVLIIGGSQGGVGSAVADRIEGMKLGEVLLPNDFPHETGTYPELDVTDSLNVVNYLEENDPYSITHVVYTAARNIPRPAMETSMPQMLKDYELNVAAFVNLVCILRQMGQGSLKSVVAVSSDARRIPMRGSVSYCATKAALSQAVAVLASEWRNAVRVNAVAPTSIENTPMTKSVNKLFAAGRDMTPEAALKYELAGLPLGRKVTKDEVAHAITDVLFGPEYMTGTTVDITGGK